MLQDQAVNSGHKHPSQPFERHRTTLSGPSRRLLAPVGDDLGVTLVLPGREILQAWCPKCMGDEFVLDQLQIAMLVDQL